MLSSDRGETDESRRSKKVELSSGDVETKNNDDNGDDNEEVLVVHRSRMPRVRARSFLSHNSLCTPVSNNDTARAYLMHCDKEFKESAEERFHPDPSLMTRERERERRVRGGKQRKRTRAREAHREREKEKGGEGRERPGKGFDRAHRLTPFVAV